MSQPEGILVYQKTEPLTTPTPVSKSSKYYDQVLESSERKQEHVEGELQRRLKISFFNESAKYLTQINFEMAKSKQLPHRGLSESDSQDSQRLYQKLYTVIKEFDYDSKDLDHLLAQQTHFAETSVSG